MKLRSRLAALILSAALASCGGGGASAVPAPQSPGQPQSGSAAKVRLTIPNSAPASSTRRRNFVSSTASGATVAAGPHGGTLTTSVYDISSGSAACATTATVRTCTLNVVVPVGSDDFVITIYDTAPTSGAIPATAHVLGVATVTQTIVSGTPLTIPFFVQGVIAGYGTIQPLITFPADGGTYTQNMLFNPADFSNQSITAGVNDPYKNPILVSVAETPTGSGFMHLTVNGIDVGTSTTLTQSSQTLGVKYLSGGGPGYFATVTLSATGVAPASFNVAPMYVTSSSPYYSNGVLSFTNSGQSAVVNVSEAAGTNTYGTLASSCTASFAISTVTGSGATGSFTVTSGNSGVASGGCSIGVTDSANTALAIAYKQTATSSGLQIGGITEYPTPISQPNLIATGADGNLYVAGDLSGDGSIWVYTTGDAEAGWYNALVPAQLPVAEAVGPDGNMWYVGGGSQVFHNTNNNITTSGCCTAVTPTGASKLAAVIEGPDGNMWVADPTVHNVYAVTTTGVTTATYTFPTLSPAFMTTSFVDNAAWIVSPSATSSTLVEQQAGSNPVSIAIPNTNVGPSGVTTDAAGNVWIAEKTENQIDEYNISTLAWNQFPIAANDGPAGITIGSDGNVWFTGQTSNTIVRLHVTSPTVYTFTHYPIPTAASLPSSITSGADGRVWFTESAFPTIGAITP